MPYSLSVPARRSLLCILLIIVVGAVLCRGVSLAPSLRDAANPIDLGIEEIHSHHLIRSVFLPVVFPGILGWAEIAASHLHLRPDFGAFAVEIGVLVGIYWFARSFLMGMTSERFASFVALAIALYPQYCWGVRNMNDTNLAFMVILAFLVGYARAKKQPTLRNAALCGIALGVAVAVRPNLGLLSLLLCGFFGLGLTGVKRATASAAVATLAYCIATAVFHGRPFFPQNGPYNTFAGFNPYTEGSLRLHLNAEPSIQPAVARQGLTARLNWRVQSDVPGVDDTRDLRYIPFYKQQYRQFLRDHPRESLRLTALKAATLFRQNYTHKSTETAMQRRAAAVIKTVAVLVFPLWLGLIALTVLWQRQQPNYLVMWTVGLYLLPFLIINSDPRFRSAIEGLVLLDIARMLWTLFLRSRLKREPDHQAVQVASSHVSQAGTLSVS